MKSIWDEKPDLFVVIGELEDTVNIGNMTITTEEGDDFIKEFKKFDAWLEKLKNVLDSQQKVFDELNRHGIIVWDTFIGKWVIPAHLKGIKEKAEKWDEFLRNNPDYKECPISEVNPE